MEYIESTGTQYIDTGIKNAGNLIIELDTSISSDNNQQGVFGAKGTSGQYCQLRLYTGENGDIDKLQYNYGNNTNAKIAYNTSIPNLNTSNRVKYIFGNGLFLYDYNIATTYSIETFDNNYAQTSIIFGMKELDSSVDWLSKMKLYSLKMYNNTTVRDFIPVKRKSDNEICLYDKVTETFFINQGTGDFIAGPEKEVEE